MESIELDPEEKAILDSIALETGYRFRRVGGIPTDDPDVAARVLPVLRSWVPGLVRPNIRGAVYHRFMCPGARDHFDALLSWVKVESDTFNLSILKQALTLVVTKRQAAALWEAVREKIDVLSDFRLVIKLAGFPSTRDEALQVLHEFLASRGWEIAQIKGRGVASAIEALSRMREPSIQAWFAQHIDSPNPEMRVCALRASGVQFKIPKGFRKVRGRRNLPKPVFSTEVDSWDLGQVAQKLEEDYGIQVPAEVRSGGIFHVLLEECWIVCQCPGQGEKRMDLWLRREDLTTVEVGLVAT